MARWWRIDAPVDDGDASADEAVGVECGSGKRPDLSRTQGFDRGEGAGQHHRALSTLEIFVVTGVGEFSGGGLGRVVVEAIQRLDYLVVQSVLVLLVVIFVTANLLADIIYGFVDPRVRVR